MDDAGSQKRPAPVVHHALLLGGAAAGGRTAASKKQDRPEAAADPDPDDPLLPSSATAAASTIADGGAAAADQTNNDVLEREATPSPSPSPSSFLPDEVQSQVAGVGVDLQVFLPGGTQGIRGPMLARNWVRRLGNRVQGKPGTYMCVFLDKGRIPGTIVTGLEKTIGYDPALHDPVVFFDRRGRRLVGSFGAVLGGTGQLWGPEAFAEMSARDASAAWAFQGFLEGEAFHWLECEQCGKWRMYPHEDVLLPGEGEGGVFVCAMAATWNPAVRGCETEQEFSFDSVQSPTGGE